MANIAKTYPPDTVNRFSKLAPVLVVVFVLGAILQHIIDPEAKQFHKGEANIGNASAGLNNEFMLLPLLGFREAAAGLLWVRCDEFFHSGDYDAILPLVRLITWLDPHADNIYVTGAWHLAYNFTDSSERSDRRYIAPAQALLDEGILNNMGIPDIKFEKGWQNYDKIKDYAAAEKAFLMADQTKPMVGGDDYPYGSPLKTMHILAHTYEKQGKIPEALATWNRAIERSDEMMAKKKDDYSVKQLSTAEHRNHDELLQRYHDRYTPTGHSTVNKSAFPAVIRPSMGSTKTSPWDVSFQPQIEVKRAKVLKISGNFNSADGARVDVRITDWNYKERAINQELNSFDIDLSQTILIDSISVRKNHFDREMDMSKDPKMYGFNQDFYRIVLSYNTRGTSPHLQDRFGWSGEGITDTNGAHVTTQTNKLFLGTMLIANQGGTGPLWDGSTVTPWSLKESAPKWYGVVPTEGQPPRLIKVTYKVSRDQINAIKPITDADIIPNE